MFFLSIISIHLLTLLDRGKTGIEFIVVGMETTDNTEHVLAH